MNSQPDNFFPQKSPYCYGPSNISSTKPIVSSSKELADKQSINPREKRSNESTRQLQQKIDILESQLLQITNVLQQQGSYAEALEELTYQNKQLKSQIQQKQQLLQNYAEQIEKQQRINEQLKTQLQKMGDEMTNLGKEILRNSQKKDQEQKLKNFYEESISNLKEKYINLQKEHQQAIRSNKKIIQQYNEVLKINEQLKEANQTQHTLLTQLQGLLPSRQQNSIEQDRVLQQARLELQSKNKLIQDLLEKVRNLQNFKKSKQNLITSEVYQLRSQINRLNLQKSQLKQANESVKKKYEQKLTQLQDQVANQMELNRKYKTQKYKQQSQLKQIQFDQIQYKRNQENQIKFWKDKEAYYLSQIQKLRQMLVSMQSDKNMLDIQHHNCASTIDHLEKQLKQCYKNLDNEQKQYEALNQKLKSTVKLYESSIQSIKNKFSTLEAEKSSLLTNFKQSNSKSSVLQEKYTEIIQKYEQRQNILKNLAKELETTQNKNKQLQLQNKQKIQKQIQSAQRVHSLTMQIQDLQGKISKLQKQINFQKIQRSSLDSTIQQAQQHVKILEIEQAQLIQKYNQSLSELQMHRQEKKQYQQRLDAHISKIQQQLNQKNQQLKKLQLTQIEHNKILMQKDYEMDRTKAQYVNQIDELLVENKIHRQNIEKLLRGENFSQFQLESFNGFTFSLGGRQIENNNQSKSNQKLVDKLEEQNSNLKRIINDLKKQIQQIQANNRVEIQNNISVNKFLSIPRPSNDTHNRTHSGSRNLYSKQQTPNHSQNNGQYQQSSLQKIQILEKRLQRANKDISKLDKAIQQLLIEHQITPRDGNCTIYRTIWLIEILSTQLLQYKNDAQILRKQKRTIAKQKQKLILMLQTAENEKEKLYYQIEQLKKKSNYRQEYGKPHHHTNYNDEKISKKVQENSYLNRNLSEGNIRSRLTNNYTQNQQSPLSNGNNKSSHYRQSSGFKQIPKLPLSQDYIRDDKTNIQNFRQERRKLFGKVRQQIMGVFD